VLSGVLFDLDGTLLDIDLDSFLSRYFSVLGPVVASVLGHTPEDPTGLRAVIAATQVMSGSPTGVTNKEAFNAEFTRITGVDLGSAEHEETLEAFYSAVFPTLQDSMGPKDGAVEVVETALELGLSVAIATNPIFPMSAVRERMRWAGLADMDIPVVTAYENMCAAKPHSAYYRQTAELMGVNPRACLMVGDDRTLDMPAADIGMSTFYVGPQPTPECTWSGSLRDLASLLERLTD
jgi:FMN phosphatase YigB (HAD superfamily)